MKITKILKIHYLQHLWKGLDLDLSKSMSTNLQYILINYFS